MRKKASTGIHLNRRRATTSWALPAAAAPASGQASKKLTVWRGCGCCVAAGCGAVVPGIPACRLLFLPRADTELSDSPASSSRQRTPDRIQRSCCCLACPACCSNPGSTGIRWGERRSRAAAAAAQESKERRLLCSALLRLAHQRRYLTRRWWAGAAQRRASLRGTSAPRRPWQQLRCAGERSG